jgi:hypothetical protein
MRKNTILLFNLIFFLGFLSMGAVGAHSDSFVTNLSLEKKGDFTYFTVYAEDKIEFTHFILPAKEDKPHRIVVDLKDAIHRLPKNNFRNLPPGTVKAIRTSQYQVEPGKITRVVLDLKEPVIYSVVEQKKENQITLALSTKKDPPSIFWAVDSGVLKTGKEVPRKLNIQKQEKEELAQMRSVSTPEGKPAKTEVKSKIKKDKPKPQEKPKDLAAVKEKSPIKEAEIVSAPAESKKGKDKEKVSKTMEVKKDTPPVEEVAESPEKHMQEKLESTQQKVVPVVSPDTSSAPPEVLTKSGEEAKGIAERESLIYQSEGRRDPFVPVSQEIDFEFGEIPLPAVENLKLVGTLEDQYGYKALLEDDRGYGYLLKSGDRVKNGFVVNIFKNKIFLQIEEYGWSRTICLELPPEY